MSNPATTPDVDEAALVERLRVGDEAAFKELVRDQQAAIYRLLYRLMGDASEAEDLAQEVFVRVFMSIGQFRADSRLSTWLFRIATNHAQNRLRYLARRGRKERRTYDEHMDPAAISSDTTARIAQPDRLVEGFQAERHMQLALATLDAEQRSLIVLRDLESLSYEEVRQITGLPIGTVKSRLHRARLQLFQSYTALQGDAL